MSKNLYKNSTTFYCFTPVVSLATFAIEIILAIFVLIKYKHNKFNLLSIAMLIFLGIFQFSEYMICKTSNTQLWANIGLTSIILLPAIGLHLISIITVKSKWTKLGYLIAGVAISLLNIQPINNLIQCTGKYIILEYQNPYDTLFTIYYMGLLLLGLYKLLIFKYKSNFLKIASRWFVVGYLSFMLPSFLIAYLTRITNYALPSIMCGFAVIFAVILVFKIIPNFNKYSKR
jgi:hypothetical protein